MLWAGKLHFPHVPGAHGHALIHPYRTISGLTMALLNMCPNRMLFSPELAQRVSSPGMMSCPLAVADTGSRVAGCSLCSDFQLPWSSYWSWSWSLVPGTQQVPQHASEQRRMGSCKNSYRQAWVSCRSRALQEEGLQSSCYITLLFQQLLAGSCWTWLDFMERTQERKCLDPSHTLALPW